ncbi:MAG: hypothetical protein AB8U25_00235 [Rickettsiales endosymbiont of Dermacentor nuttalli]
MKIIYIFLMIICVVGKLIFLELFDNHPFRFEQYTSKKDFEVALKKQFLLGRDINKTKEFLNLCIYRLNLINSML